MSSAEPEAPFSPTGSNPPVDEGRWVTYNIWDLYPDWQSEAYCKGVGTAHYFGDEATQPTMSIKQVRQAAKLCAMCPVYTECLSHALTIREEYGVWAGTSGRVRRAIFALMDVGLVDVEDVVNHFLNGNGDFYKQMSKVLIEDREKVIRDGEAGAG